MTGPVDVRTVLDWQVRQAESRCDTARTMRGADARLKERDELRATRDAVDEVLTVTQAYLSELSQIMELADRQEKLDRFRVAGRVAAKHMPKIAAALARIGAA